MKLTTVLRCVVGFLVAVAVVIGVTSCGGHHKHRPTPAQLEAPPSSPQPSRCQSGDNHSLGACLPRPVGRLPNVKVPAGIRCIDLSNNDPVYSVSSWRAIRAAGITCAVLKVNESTTFVDRTAAAMARSARAAGVIVGGYDFQHVCGPSPSAEADVFAAYLKADGLVGPGTLRPAADVEYPAYTSCNGPAWESAWRAEVKHRLNLAAFTYTGEWWWGPHFGGYWPSDSEDWISGYGVSWPYMPSGRPHLDMWQYTDAGWNGASHSDMEVWLNGSAAFTSYLVTAAPAPPQHCLDPRHYPHVAWCLRVRYGYHQTQLDLAKVQNALAHHHCVVAVGICGGYFWAQGRDLLILADFRRRYA